MRIIAGKYRGRVLSSFRGDKVRPTKDRVKESLFAILSDKISGARVLDLFCGSGALGIECLSRGAREAVFNDCERKSLALCKKNLVRVTEPFTLLNLDFKTCLSRMEPSFDLIFSDPPYREDYLPQILRLVGERNLLNAGGVIVHESEREERCAPGWRVFDERNYGRTRLYFIEKEV